MAVCGLLSMLCVSPIQPDMDSCPSHSSGVTRNHLNFWQSGTGPRASSCLSSTMVDHNDPDDSGSSQPPTPTRATTESKHSAIRDTSLPQHELELSISSLNDAQRGTPQRLRSVKNEFGQTSASTGREDTYALGGSAGIEEEPSFSGPPRKRARMSPLGLSLEENQAGNVREQLLRHSSISVSSDVTGLHNLMPSRSLPSFRSTEREPSPSPSRAASGPGSRPTTSSWWLGPGPKSSTMISTEAQQFQSVQESARANFATDGRGMIPGTSLQERDFMFKEPSFFPNMLSSMEASEHVRRGEGTPPTAGGRTKEQGRPPALLDPHEHPFFTRKESSTSRASNISMVSEETVPRSGTPIFGKDREAPFQEATTVYGQQIQRPFEGGRRRHPSASESQHAFLEREPSQGGFPRPQQAEQRTLLGPPPVGNANTTFYARILDAALQPVSSPFSQAGLAGPFNVNPGLSFNLAGQSLPRSSSQIGAGPVHFGGEAANSNLVQQQVNSEFLRNMLAANQSISPIPSFMSQPQNPDPARLNIPNLSSLDFLQSLQRQQAQGTDRFRPAPGQVVGSHPPQQDFSFLGAPQPSHHSLSTEMNPSFPRGSQPGNLPTSSGLRDFLSPQVPRGSPSVGLGRGPAIGGPHGFSSSALEIPTHLSLQAPAAPPLTVVMEGRSIGRRIVLQDYDGYDNFAAAMRSMVDSHVSSQEPRAHGENCTLANAIPGYVIAYEDEEGDILLAGDLPWRDFVRAAKQIRIVSSSKISFKPAAGPSRS